MHVCVCVCVLPKFAFYEESLEIGFPQKVGFVFVYTRRAVVFVFVYTRRAVLTRRVPRDVTDACVLHWAQWGAICSGTRDFRVGFVT